MDACKYPRITAVFGLVLALFARPETASAQDGFRGPYLSNISPDAVTVSWETRSPSTGVVRFGLMNPDENSVASATPATHHAVRLTGLAAIAPPGSDFTYVVESDGRARTGRFFTAVTGDAPFSFVVYGDNRSSREQHQAVVDALMREQRTASFAINTGDLVARGDDEALWDEFFEVESPFLATMPLYVAIGNHEVDGGEWDVPRRIFNHPTDVPPASNDESFYHVVYGNTELIVLNVEVASLYTVGALAGAQEAWLSAVLAAPPPGVRHRFAFIHKGPYSSKRGRTGNYWLRQWLDRFEAAGVRIVFSGHDHYAERGFTRNGLYYVIHGGGGAPLYDTLGVRVVDDHTIAYGETRLGYAVVDIDGSKVSVRIKGIDGQVVDSFSYGNTAAPECTAPVDCGAPPRNACPGGAWSCVEAACTWACAPSTETFSCITDRVCEDRLGPTCNGTARCERPSLNPLGFYCTCNAASDCGADVDCRGRPSPMPCPGTWACVEAECEFTADPACVLLDAGPSDAGDAPAPDASSPLDAGRPASNTDAAVASADASTGAGEPRPARSSETVEAPSSAASSESRGCTAAEGASAELNPVWAALLALSVLGLRRRRAPYRQR